MSLFPMTEPARLFPTEDIRPDGWAFREPVAFGPGVPLQISTKIALGADLRAHPSTWTWTELPAPRYDIGFSVSDGRPDNTSIVPTGRSIIKIPNNDGRFSRLNPNSPYFGQLTRNVPIWVTINPGNGTYDVIQHFVNEWPARWDSTRTDFTTTIQCAGIMRRLGQGAVSRSALKRTILASNPIAYWPMDDGPDTTVLASALPGGPSLLPDAAVTPGVVDGPFEGYGPYASGPGTARIIGTVPVVTSTSWRVEMIVKNESSGSPLALLTQGTGARWIINIAGAPNPPTEIQWTVQNSSDVNLVNISIPNQPSLTSVWDHYRLEATQNGGNVGIVISLNGTVIYNNSAAFAGTLGPIFGLNMPTGAGTLAELAIWAPWTSAASVDTAYAARAYQGENALTRISRICVEEGIPFTANGPTWNMAQTALGVQPTGGPLDVMRDAEQADGGVLYEVGWGLGYQPLISRYNAPVAMTIDYSSGALERVPEPTDDDQKLRNSWSISRKNGISDVVVKNDDSIAREGLYDDSAVLNLFLDAQAAQVASFRTHVGTNDDYRWPVISIRLDSPAGKQLIEQWKALAFGARIQINNLPTEVTPNPVEVFREKRSEKFDQFTWVVELNTSSALPFEIHQIEAPGNRGRIDSAASTLATAISTTDTSLSVAVADGALWRTGTPPGGSADLQLTIDGIDTGEKVTVTNVTGGSSPQTFTVTRSVNDVVRAWPIGAMVRLWRPGRWAL